MSKTTFIGGGCNDSNLFRAVANANDAPSKKTLPAAATWPFVKLQINNQLVEFRMAQIKKHATPSDSRISLDRLGYVRFRNPGQGADFGFYTLRLGTLTRELRRQGFQLDDSFGRNKYIARISQIVSTAVPLIALIVIVVG